MLRFDLESPIPVLTEPEPMPRPTCFLASSAFAVTLFVAGHAASAQTTSQGTWAARDDPDAKMMIEAERKWAIDDCQPSNVVDEYLADDFVGTSPEGPIYTKADMQNQHSAPNTAHDCQFLGARLRYYGPTVAIIYGHETAILRNAAGKDYRRTLVWTDTWLKRNGKWQIIAVQDMVDPRKYTK